MAAIWNAFLIEKIWYIQVNISKCTYILKSTDKEFSYMVTIPTNQKIYCEINTMHSTHCPWKSILTRKDNHCMAICQFVISCTIISMNMPIQIKKCSCRSHWSTVFILHFKLIIQSGIILKEKKIISIIFYTCYR